MQEYRRLSKPVAGRLNIADRDCLVRAWVLAKRSQPARRLGQIAYNRLLGGAASMNKPGSEGAKARIFLSDAAASHQSTVAQELKKCSRATPPPNHARGGQRSALATKKALAIVLSETLDVGVIHILCPNPRQAEPMDKVLGGGDEHALASSAVAQDDEVIAIGGQESGYRAKILGNGNGAVIFKKANEPANIGEVPRPMRLSWAIARASAPMAFEALYDGDIHLT